LGFLAADIARKQLDEFAGNAGLPIQQLEELIAVYKSKLTIFQRLGIVGIGLLEQNGSITEEGTGYTDTGGQFAALEVRQEPAYLAFLYKVNDSRGGALLVDKLLFLIAFRT